MKLKPDEATCAACLARKSCVTKRTLQSGITKSYDNFFYSPQHKGWICKPCMKKLEKKGGGQRDLVDYMNEKQS